MGNDYLVGSPNSFLFNAHILFYLAAWHKDGDNEIQKPESNHSNPYHHYSTPSHTPLCQLARYFPSAVISIKGQLHETNSYFFNFISTRKKKKKKKKNIWAFFHELCY